MGRMKDRNASAGPEVKPAGLSPSRFVKVFMHGEPFERKINLAIHNNYDSLSFTLKRLGNNYSSKLISINCIHIHNKWSVHKVVCA